MNTPAPTIDVLTEVWTIKDSLSASFGHDLKATCRAMYAEQQKHPENFINLGALTRPDKTTTPTAGTASVVSAKSTASGR